MIDLCHGSGHFDATDDRKVSDIQFSKLSAEPQKCLRGYGAIPAVFTRESSEPPPKLRAAIAAALAYSKTVSDS